MIFISVKIMKKYKDHLIEEDIDHYIKKINQIIIKDIIH